MTARLRLHVTPRASRNEIVGWREDALAIRLTAPPVEGAANRACVELVAQILDISKSRIRVAAGHKSRDKTVEIEGLTDAQVRACVDAAFRA